MALMFTDNSQRLLIGRRSGRVTVRDLATREQVDQVDVAGRVSRMTLSPDGGFIVNAFGGAIASVWHAGTARKAFDLAGHTINITSVAVSPDSRRIVTASWDASIKVWDASTGQELLTLKGHTAFLTCVTFSPSGRRIATASEDGTVNIWTAAKPEDVTAWRKEDEEAARRTVSESEARGFK